MHNNYLEVNYLRVFALILLVVWHCFFCPMFVWGVIEQQETMKLFRLLSQFVIVDAAMPLFTFISGYLFTALYIERGKYKEFFSFLFNKGKRLIIPFFVFSVLVIGTSYRLSFEPIIWGEGSHMWYCAMLFWCFMIGWFVKRLNCKTVNFLLFALSVLLVVVYPNFWCMPLSLPLGIDNSFYYYSYFAMGESVFMLRAKLLRLFEGKIFLLWFLYICIFSIRLLEVHIISRLAQSIQTYYFLITIWATIIVLVYNQKLRASKKLTQLCKYSFGIYVFHHWLAWNIVWFPPLSDLLKQHYILIPILLTVIVFASSYYLTKFSLQTKIGRFLLS